ncbi:hypothetical protein KAR29_02800 [Aminithiophilus ramosus]|uniref:Condensation domain-containing protein n=1 Tax=Aminithiophilus ramosus TaxID=3029084 RepID=A0A9Q7AQ91_9BACT|nr:hypothetical protein [Aminithiophilus ramosus]QTX32867.1 hypothetical protein KAR29_02800 [Aminithiophilus ramosus]
MAFPFYPTRFPAPLSDVMQHVIARPGQYLIHMVLRFDGLLDENRLRRAAFRLVRVVPVLGCRLVEEEDRFFWEPSDIGPFSPFSLVLTADPEGDSVRFVKEPLPPQSPFRFRLALFRSPRSGDRLVFKIDHVCCDGRGLLRCLALLASLYADPLCVLSPLSPGRDFARRGLIPVLQALSKETFLEALPEGDSPPSPPWGFPFRDLPPEGPDFVLRVVERDTFRRLRACGQRRGCTVNDLLLTAYYRALFDVLVPEEGCPMALGVTVDLRRYLDEPSGAVANRTGVAFASLPRIAAESFAATLARVAAVMETLKGRGPGLATALLFEILPRLGVTAARSWLEGRGRSGDEGAAPPLLSNLGDVTTPRGAVLRFGDVAARSAFLLGPALAPPDFLLVASTYDDELTLSVAFQSPCYSRPALEPFLALVEAQLLLFLSPSPS